MGKKSTEQYLGVYKGKNLIAAFLIDGADFMSLECIDGLKVKQIRKKTFYNYDAADRANYPKGF